MAQYIDSEKLIAEINALKDRYGSCVAKNGVEKCYKGGRLIGYEDALYKINQLQQEQSEVGLFESPETPIKDTVEVTSRMRYIDEDLKPIAEFIMDYASWNLHKNEWNQPTLEVPLFRVLDALVQKGKPYCEA